MQCVFCGLVSEDFFKSEGLDRAKGAEILGVKVLDITEDTILVCAVFYPLLLSLLHILKGEGRECLIYLL